MGNYVRRFIQPTLSFKDRRALDWEQRWAKQVLAGTPKTASRQLDLDRIMPDPDAPNFNGYIGWVEALHRTGLQSKAIYQAYLSNPWMALSYAASCQGWKASPDILAAIQQHEGALAWYEEQAFDDLVAPHPEIDDAFMGLGGGDEHFASAKTAADLGLHCLWRTDTLVTVMDTLERYNLVSKQIRAAFTLPLARTLLDKYPWGRKRWLEGAIATDPRRAGDYALRSIPIGERWTEGEPAIAEAILTRTGRVRDCAIRYYIAHVLGVVLRAPVDLDPAYPIKAKEWAKAVHAGQPRQAAVA